MKHYTVKMMVGCAVLMGAADAMACCPGDGHQSAAAATGLGMTAPATDNVSADANWNVYEFERGGIHYVQVDDLSGVVRMAVGFIDDISWAMPIGSDADRVSTPLDPLAIPATATRTVVYRSPDGLELAAYVDANGITWDVRKAAP